MQAGMIPVALAMMMPILTPTMTLSLAGSVKRALGGTVTGLVEMQTIEFS
jgi:hypothetical protein